MTLSKKPERSCDSMEVRLYNRGWNDAVDAITSPQPAQQEPVAWLVDNGGDAVLIRHSENFPGIFAGSEFNKRPLVYGDTSPPAQRKPLPDFSPIFSGIKENT